MENDKPLSDLTVQTETPAPPLTARNEVALRRQAALSVALRRQAVALRDRPPLPALLGALPGGGVSLRDVVARGGITFRNFLFFCALPAAAAVGFVVFAVSNQYVSEAQFAVHSGDKPQVDAISALTGVSSIDQVRDTLIVADYIKSRTMVEALLKQLDLRAMFAKDGIDYLSRWNRSWDGSIESLVDYWGWKVSTKVDSQSGIVTVDVKAFTPEDSLAISRAALALSEDLINHLSERSRNDALNQARLGLDRAKERLRVALDDMRKLRDRQGTLDPRKEAEGLGKVLGDLRLNAAKLRAQISAETAMVSATAPQVLGDKAVLAATEREITQLEAKLTRPNDPGQQTIATDLAAFDRADIERSVAQAQFAAAADAFERARVEAERKTMYVHTFVQPELAQESLYPKRFLFSAACVAAVALLWLLGNLAWFTARARGLLGAA